MLPLARAMAGDKNPLLVVVFFGTQPRYATTLDPVSQLRRLFARHDFPCFLRVQRRLRLIYRRKDFSASPLPTLPE